MPPAENKRLLDSKRLSNNRTRKFSIREAVERVIAIFVTVFNRNKHEKPKVVWRISRQRALFGCWIHLLPVSAIVTVACFSLRGWYIGDKYPGDPRESTQELTVLGLQVTAKLLELLVIASLGMTIRDILRFVLIRSNHGLPLGLITAESSFTEIKFFFSTTFWSGISGLWKGWQKLLVAFWIIASGIIVALAGPSAAVLVLPTMRPAWPAGSAFFHAVGNSTDLFPSTLDDRSGGGPLCDSPSVRDVESPIPDYLGCPWAGYSTLLSTYTQWGSDLFIHPHNPINFYEWQQPRQIFVQIRAPGETPESWATATQPAINLWAGSLHIAWRRAIASKKAPPQAANFKWLPGTTAHIPTKLPAVRTVCHVQKISEYTTNWSFPLLEPFSVWSGRTFFLPRRHSSTNSSNREPVVEWVPLPTSPVYTSVGDTTNVYASALLAIQVPQSKNGIPASTMTCSVDARWGPGEALMGNGPLIPVLDSAHLRAPPEQTNSYNQAAGFLPKDDGSWQYILLKPEWLKTLTPILESNGKNQSTLAILFEAIGLINGTISIPDTDIVYSVAANAVATLVTDGISRIGTHSQAGNPTISACYIDPQDFPSFFSGDQQEPSYTYPPPVGVSAANQTQMRWYITIPGLAYKADNIAIQLALALLFFYIAMALSHIGWIIWTGYFFGAWKNPAELMILAKNSSPAPGSLANTCAGIETSGMWKRTARVRVAEGQKMDDQEEELHLLIDAVGGADTTYEKAKSGVAYGQRRAESPLAL